MNADLLLKHFDSIVASPSSIKQMRETILQLAVMGKIVEQNFEDEPASELLKRIKAEQERLIAEGKLKTQKALPSITDEEIPYELPPSWKWVKLASVGIINPRNSTND
ncbi:MAG: restriction endonuclease subunit S, partial [Candidatus Riesia sp.]|nr:restriction endonuclease subunit S [Candidatus Riesia sp.]